ncbi:hypothetical protein EVAR_27488_1 [Eumeta japonica]|uniref:Uncharacterized protein n=1 Tax=Eumeta variegata TaxID=151549 RepID=A0A4C1XCI3_EUMVA|nr:hypothetical protein EVAR_27488_1 [Eumeta japonica]
MTAACSAINLGDGRFHTSAPRAGVGQGTATLKTARFCTAAVDAAGCRSGRLELLSRTLSTAIESRNSVTKIKPNTLHSAYHLARPSVRLTCMYMVRVYEARTDRDELLQNRTITLSHPCVRPCEHQKNGERRLKTVKKISGPVGVARRPRGSERANLCLHREYGQAYVLDTGPRRALGPGAPAPAAALPAARCAANGKLLKYPRVNFGPVVF